MAERQRVRIGLVGAGFLARTRVRCYRKIPGPVAAEVAAVTARTAESARGFAAGHGIERVCGSLDELLGSDVDVVDLCVPNHLHRPFAEAAAAAGKHVVCTKPLSAYVGQDLIPDAPDSEVSRRDRRAMLAVAVREGEAMVAAARRAGVQLMYGENWVYAPAIARARALLAAAGGSILEMRGWECHHGSHSPYSKRWRHAGGGALLRLGAHPLGAMLELKRGEGLARSGAAVRPVAVTGDVADLSRVPAPAGTMRVASGWEDVESWGCAVVEFSDGARGTAFGSDGALGGMESHLSVFGSNCRLECRLSPVDLLRAYAPESAVFEGEYLMEKLEDGGGWSTAMPDEDWTSGHVAMCEDFVGAAAAGRPARSDGELGVAVTRVAYAAYVAAAEGRRQRLAE